LILSRERKIQKFPKGTEKRDCSVLYISEKNKAFPSCCDNNLTLSKEDNMKRKDVYKEIEGMLGVVPSMFKSLPDSSLELEWQLFKRVQFDEGAIPNKYRELIGVAISAITKCRFCSFYHTEVAKLNGATEAEIEDAVHFAKSSAGWSTYINGLQIDYDEFKEEIRKTAEYMRVMQEKNKMPK